MTEANMLAEKNMCTGCGACTQACPFGCIEMVSDEEGFFAPVTDKERCVSCGLCRRVCHAVNPPELGSIKDCFAVSANDKEIYAKSASGGAFTLIAKAFLKGGGLVYGAASDREGNIRHICIDDEESLYLLGNSKYAQSSTDRTFIEIEKHLRDGRKVLFSGTGCQVAALKAYLGGTYSTIYTIDLICHGTPSQGFLKRHLEYISEGPFEKIIFRRKGGASEVSQYCIGVKPEGKKPVCKDASKDAYMNLFVNSKSFREACYECPYARKERAGDMTLGDIHRSCILGDATPLRSFTGVLIDTEKGRELFNLIGEGDAEIHPADKAAYIRTNKRLSFPASRPEERGDVYKAVMAEPYDTARLKPYMTAEHKSMKKMIKRLVPLGIQRLFKK